MKKLTELEESREALAYMIVHDMKTPLQVVMGHLDIMKQNSLEGKVSEVETVANALTQSHRLVEMIDSILEVGRLESGVMQLNPQPVDLKQLVANCAEDSNPTQGGCSISFDLPEEGLVILADKEILRRVIHNLISNSVKHAGENATIRMRAEGIHGFAHFTISDNGPGILPEHRDKIFKKYTRFQTAKTKEPISTGLGLTFCKLAIELHQGTIRLESEPGEGCTVSFSLPLVSTLVSAD